MQIAIFISGFILGILALVPCILMGKYHRVYHEIEWHDAKKEKPSLYIVPGQNFIHLLIHNKNGTVIDANYYVDDESFDYEAWENVTHFAYIDEVKLTIPPCPVCSGAFTDDPFNPYANQSTL